MELFKIMIMFGFIVGVSASAKTLNTTYGSDFPFFKHVLVSILAYDPATRSYTVQASDFPAEGTASVTPESLGNSVSAIDLERILEHPDSIVGDQFRTDTDMPTLSPAEKNARRRRR